MPEIPHNALIVVERVKPGDIVRCALSQAACRRRGF
jgi:hypothetical protein